MTHTPEISVIIPVYNGAATIAETLNSVLNQTFEDFEVLVINDGSTDDTARIVSAYDDPRIKLHHYDNAGQSIARNRGIALAQGRYLAFLDADDLWTPDKLADQLEALYRNPYAAVAYSWTAVFNEHGQWLCKRLFHEGWVLDDLLLENFIASGSNILVKREAVREVGFFDPRPKGCEDWDYYLRLAEKYQYAVVPKEQILYRLSTTSMSSGLAMMEKSMIIACSPWLTKTTLPTKKIMANIYLSLTIIGLPRVVTFNDLRNVFGAWIITLVHDPALALFSPSGRMALERIPKLLIKLLFFSRRRLQRKPPVSASLPTAPNIPSKEESFVS